MLKSDLSNSGYGSFNYKYDIKYDVNIKIDEDGQNTEDRLAKKMESTSFLRNFGLAVEFVKNISAQYVVTKLGFVALISLMMFLMAFSYSREHSDSIVLEAIGVPQKLSERGITAAVVEDMVRQNLHKVARQTLRIKDFRDVASLQRIPEVDVPIVGVSAQTLFDTMFFFMPPTGTRVRGWITCADEICDPARLRLTLVVVNHETYNKDSVSDKGIRSSVQFEIPAGGSDSSAQLKELVDHATMAIYQHADPFAYAAINNKKGQTDQAAWEEAFRVAHNIATSDHPDSKYAYNLLGVMMYDRKYYDHAKYYFNKAIEIDKSFAVAYHNKGNVFNKERKYEAAFTSYSEAYDAESSDYLRPFTIAFMADMTQKTKDSRFVFEELKERDFLEKGENKNSLEISDFFEENSIALYMKSIDFAENNKQIGFTNSSTGSAISYASRELASMLANQGKMEEAFLYYAKAAANTPTHASTHYRWGSLLLREGRLKEAEFVLERAKELYSKTKYHKTKKRVRSKLAILYFKNGNLEKAIDEIFYVEYSEKPEYKQKNTLKEQLTEISLSNGDNECAMRIIKEILIRSKIMRDQSSGLLPLCEKYRAILHETDGLSL